MTRRRCLALAYGRRKTRDGTYVMHFAHSAEMALERLSQGIEPTLIVMLRAGCFL